MLHISIMCIIYVSIIIGIIIYICQLHTITEPLDNSQNSPAKINSSNIGVLQKKYSQLEANSTKLQSDIDFAATTMINKCCSLNKEYLCKNCKKHGYTKLGMCNDPDYCNRCGLAGNKDQDDKLCKTKGNCKPCAKDSDNVDYTCCMAL